MKRVIIASLVIMLVMPSCKFIRTKILSKKVDTLSAFVDTLSHAEIIDSSIYYQDVVSEMQKGSQPVADPAVSQPAPALDARYYMVVGCFMVPENAARYADKIRGMGYEGGIISGYGGFQMVTAKSYSNFKTSIADIDQFRAEVTPNAWVFVKK